ncbi:large ribosomal subunit protein mL62-like [Porites lutea]|uniref:large ribosomal subunit protein mL62-like n=1 Tax=Porites lutea TaxID=51062 RepID=UPI003CC6A91D
MFRSLFHRSYSYVITFRGFLETRQNNVGTLYLHTSFIKLRSIENENRNGLGISYKGKIPLDRLTIKYARSSGPGGQNVNKVNTKVDLRFHLLSADWIPENVQQKILEREKNRINKEGELVISSTKYRTQFKNLEDAIQKLETIIEDASFVPKETTPEKKAYVRKLMRHANEKRLRAKKFMSDKKRDRKQQ